MHLDAQRRRLIRLIYLCVAVSIVLLAFGAYVGVFLINLLLFAGIGFMISKLVTEIRLYYQSFKPRIVSALLDFLDNGVNYHHLSYSAEGKISKETFLASGLYKCTAEEYEAEDYISGMIREMPFELCELRVADISPVRSGMETVFQGIFIVADFLRPDMRGSLYIMPDVYRKFHAQSARSADLQQARRIENQLLPEFESVFDTYAMASIRPAQVISEDFQLALLKFYRETGRNISISIIHSKIYVALYQTKDLMEPKLWQSNVSFAQISEYLDDLERVFSIVHEMDVLN
jgi:Protein of unknown function (DUF3137)